MTKTIKRLLPAALAVLLAGCAMQPVDSTTARYRVALIAKNNRNSEFWDAVFIGAEAAATEYNLQLTITAPDDEEDYAAQNQLIADAVEDGAQAIVFSAIDYEANAAAIDAAAAAGVTVISVDSAVNSDNVAAYIGADNYGAGRMVAQSALDGMEGALCVGLINYEVNGANGRDREQGARDAFAESGRARITAAVSTHPNAASARADTLAMLRTHPEINVLIALSETTAVGAAQAVQQMQRADDLWLAAFDSNIETIDALQTGTVDTLIVQNTYGMGYFGVESAYKLLAGQGSSVENRTSPPPAPSPGKICLPWISKRPCSRLDDPRSQAPTSLPPKPFSHAGEGAFLFFHHPQKSYKMKTTNTLLLLLLRILHKNKRFRLAKLP